MLGKPDHSAGGKAVALLATTFVVIAGAVTCTFLGTFSGESPLRIATMIGACFGGIVFLLWLLRDRQPGNAAGDKWGWLARSNREKVEYRLTPRVPRQERSTEPLTPPTAESVRELTGGMTTWVPAKGVPLRPKSGPPPRPRRNP